MITHRSNLLLAAACATVTVLAATTFAQHAPTAHGSLDAMTVLPTTAPTSQAATMPAGHPQIGDPATANPVQALHEGMTAAKTGALRVLVSQGTPGGPAIAHDSVKIELLARGVPIKTYLTSIGVKGVIELHDLPLDVAFQPVVTVTHAGAEQQKVGAVMHKYQPAIEFEMPVFETTADKPAWTIGLRTIEAQVVTENNETYIRLTDMIGGFNPADRAWTGEGPANHRQTLAIALPVSAGNVQFGPGMAEADARVENGKAVRGKTMLPGSTQYVFAYDLAVKDGKATASFTAPADTTLFAFYLPAEWKVEKTTGMEVGNASGAHASGKAQLLKAKTIKTDGVISVELSGIQPPVATPKADPIVDHTTDLHLPTPQK